MFHFKGDDTISVLHPFC